MTGAVIGMYYVIVILFNEVSSQFTPCYPQF